MKIVFLLYPAIFLILAMVSHLAQNYWCSGAMSRKAKKMSAILPATTEGIFSPTAATTYHLPSSVIIVYQPTMPAATT